VNPYLSCVLLPSVSWVMEIVTSKYLLIDEQNLNAEIMEPAGLPEVPPLNGEHQNLSTEDQQHNEGERRVEIEIAARTSTQAAKKSPASRSLHFTAPSPGWGPQVPNSIYPPGEPLDESAEAAKLFDEARGNLNPYTWASDWIDGLVYIDQQRCKSYQKTHRCESCISRNRVCLILDRTDRFFGCMPSQDGGMEELCCSWCMRQKGFSDVLMNRIKMDECEAVGEDCDWRRKFAIPQMGILPGVISANIAKKKYLGKGSTAEQIWFRVCFRALAMTE
jgi:hypothetical protein